ncbi:hypothetical protein ARMA_3012 [Ardenticatena maritima]|uniref:Uncharacterized protein n=1 Tax=Ardenticatena maritima TaxID=872965 RepID=A0A0M8KBV6_9CHLR|nr:2Fe-2S iron-sulfur cluster-binding protein [Ardenticatena maritima]GAP64589.1 hypothetical protein ARMA_3012 [Ardenticatena maritima]
MSTITLTIDGQSVQVPAGTTVLQAAEQLGIEIPRLCYHPHMTPPTVCRLCVVEWEGARTLVPACVAQVREGAVIHTASERVQRARRTILELLHSAVDLSETPEVVRYDAQLGVDAQRFADGARREAPFYDDNPFYVRDYEKCILCWRCVQACGDDMQFTYALSLGGRGFHTHIATFFNAPMPETTCVFCGNCVGVCPTGALKGLDEYLLEQGVSFEALHQEKRKRKQRRKEE